MGRFKQTDSTHYKKTLPRYYIDLPFAMIEIQLLPLLGKKKKENPLIQAFP